MPLVVPGITSSDSGNTADWNSKLMGKKLGDSHDEVTFAKADLPKEHRVLSPNSMWTADYKPERLNIHVNEDGTVHKVNHG